MKTVDDAFNAFMVYRSEFENYANEDLTESDTRSKILDVLLIDVLGWQELDIRREKHLEAAGYLDYHVSAPGIAFIVEAKKQFVELKLPSNHRYSTTNSLLGGNKAQIEQVRRYCIEMAVPYSIISNGCQFIFLKAFNSDGKPWKENNCLLFNGFDDIQSRFVEFYDNLSKHSIISNGGFKFNLPIATAKYKTILSNVVNKDSELIRNQFSANLAPVIDKVFGEIFSEEREDDLEFIQECFVENRETKKNKDEIERLFGDHVPKLSNIVKAVNSDSISRQISDEISGDNITIKNSYPPKPIIIIGSKGAGKTTFINHLFKYKLNEKEIENHFLVYLDFRRFYEEKSEFLPSQLAADILEKIYSKYEDLELHSMKVLKRVYLKEIQRKDENTWEYNKANDISAYNRELSEFLDQAQSDTLKHLEHLSKYLIKERRKRLVVIIDNADQFDDEIQKNLFVFAHSLTKSTLCGSIISLREGYYYRWQNSPPFDAYESNVYHVTAPNYAEVLQKRLDYALKNASNFQGKIKGQIDQGFTVELTTDKIALFLSGLENSIFSDAKREVIGFLNHTTYPNIREGLKVFKSFLTSGHTKVYDYVLRETQRNEDRADERKTIPMHEFVKSVGLQNKLYYNSEMSYVVNLFIPAVDSNDHFLKIYILNELNEFIQTKQYSEKLVSYNLIAEKFGGLGYKINTINDALSSLIKSSMINTDRQQIDILWHDLPQSFNVELTAKGHFYLKEMINKFYYWDLIIQDTPVFDMQQYELISSAFPTATDKGFRDMRDRVNVLRLFFKYLISMEEKQPNQVLAIYGRLIYSLSQQVETIIDSMPKHLGIPALDS